MSNFALAALFTSTLQTLYMVFMSSFIGVFFGLIVGCFLFATSTNQGNENKSLYRILSIIVNATRSMPFIILLISIIPFTRLLVGTTIGTNAAIVPLAIVAVAFFARVVENALSELPKGLSEAAQSMGATTWQTFYKIYLPECLPALIRGATLTIISLIGYSAMAGAIGGGGLGELAINYGYQQFNTIIMLETVLVLIVLVQLIQVIGDWLAKQHRIRKLIISTCLLFLVAIGLQFRVATSAVEVNVIRVGVMSGINEQIMKVAQAVGKTDGINIQIVPFSDYVQPNIALNNGSIDANIFQHEPYLQTQLKAHKLNIVPIAKTFVYPMGFYSNKIKNINQLQQGAIIVIPNDPSNETRSLLLLQKFGLISLTPNKSIVTTNDIIENKLNLKFKLVDAAQTPRTLDDATLVGITNDFIGPTGLSISQAVIKEDKNSPYANLIVVRSTDLKNKNLALLAKVMHSPAVVAVTEKDFPDGAAIPAF